MGEKDWIRQYFVPLVTARGAVGLSDDVSELTCDSSRPTIVTVDAMIEGVHFLSTDPIDTIARKLVRVNVSDILSSGARPSEALLVLGWPKDRDRSDIRLFSHALGQELAAWDIQLIGGDTVTSPGGLSLSLTLTGVCVGDRPIRRSGARAGDQLWVTGQIGAAKRGYDAIMRGGLDSTYVAAYQLPGLPPLGISELISQYATAAMDISDGLLGDALQLAKASGLAVTIELGQVPFAGEAGAGEDIELASWGDDYQVLFAVPADISQEIQRVAASLNCQIACVGHLSDGEGLTVLRNGEAVNLPETLGFEHE